MTDIILLTSLGKRIPQKGTRLKQKNDAKDRMTSPRALSINIMHMYEEIIEGRDGVGALTVHEARKTSLLSIKDNNVVIPAGKASTFEDMVLGIEVQFLCRRR